MFYTFIYGMCKRCEKIVECDIYGFCSSIYVPKANLKETRMKN